MLFLKVTEMSDKKFFIGVDSDGTAFDSMTIKHTDSFIPAMISVWNLDAVRERVTEIEQYINLYSKDRGINRFPGLLKTFEIMIDEGIFDKDISDLDAFVKSGKGFSTKTLESFIEETDSDFLKEVLQWNNLSDKLFAENCKDIQPFNYVKQSLSKAIEKADIGVISSATREGLETDWKGGGIAEYTSVILGKENGSKKEQLKSQTEGIYDKECILMIGDALGDMEASKSIDALFFPIIAGKEEASWEKLYSEALDRLFDGTYKGDYEKSLIEEFYKSFE